MSSGGNGQTQMPVGVKQAHGFGSLTAERSAELAGIAVAAAAKAEVESAYVMAMKQPRHEDNARAAIVRVCANPTFAAKSRYRKPMGTRWNEASRRFEQQFVTGPSIRFAEEALRQWGNILVQQTAIYDDDHRRIVKVTVRDLQSNLSYSSEITLEKQVERSRAEDRVVLGERKNSQNKTVYIVKATEDELANKQAAHVSKAIRNSGLRLIPDYIIEEAMESIRRTIASKVKEDPDAERRRLVDQFMTLGIKASDIEQYLGHPIAQATTEDLIELQEIATSIKDGHSTWSEYVQAAKDDDEKQSELAQAKLEQVKQQMSQGKKEPAAVANAAPAPAPAPKASKAKAAAPERLASPQEAEAVGTAQQEASTEHGLDMEMEAEAAASPHDAGMRESSITDEQFQEILAYIESDRARLNLAKQIKSKMHLGKVETWSQEDRRSFLLSIQDAAKRWKVPFQQFVEEVPR